MAFGWLHILNTMMEGIHERAYLEATAEAPPPVRRKRLPQIRHHEPVANEDINSSTNP